MNPSLAKLKILKKEIENLLLQYGSKEDFEEYNKIKKEEPSIKLPLSHIDDEKFIETTIGILTTGVLAGIAAIVVGLPYIDKVMPPLLGLGLTIPYSILQMYSAEMYLHYSQLYEKLQKKAEYSGENLDKKIFIKEKVNWEEVNREKDIEKTSHYISYYFERRNI